MLVESACRKRRCKYYMGIRQDPSQTEEHERYYCPAFPDRVPTEIVMGRNPHTEKMPGQKGDFVFTPLPEGDHNTLFEARMDAMKEGDSYLPYLMDEDGNLTVDID